MTTLQQQTQDILNAAEKSRLQYIDSCNHCLGKVTPSFDMAHKNGFIKGAEWRDREKDIPEQILQLRKELKEAQEREAVNHRFMEAYRELKNEYRARLDALELPEQGPENSAIFNQPK